MIRKFALSTVLLAAAVFPAAATAAPRMEFALQDDAVFVEERWMARDKALEHARDLGTKRIRVNVLWARSLVSGADHRTPPAGGPQYDFSKVDHAYDHWKRRGKEIQSRMSTESLLWCAILRNRTWPPGCPVGGRAASSVRLLYCRCESAGIGRSSSVPGWPRTESAR